ncbi:hypothetical protein [Dactylosporangium sp. CA-233914]|uniref:hypothetical protein n=1 Tax=Dactylosporangium sp. CA-233914 TaxID=3239934 RepID=UPI003D90147E
MFNRKVRSFALTSVFLVALAGCGEEAAPPKATAQSEVFEYHPDYPAYSDLPALFKKADLVIEATIGQDSKTQYLVPSGQPANDPRLNPNAGTNKGQDAKTPVVVTVYQAKVIKVYKGSVAVGDGVAIKQLGGTLDGKTFREVGAKPLRQGDRYVLFLATYPDAPTSLLNPDQAQYPVDASGALAQISDTAPKFTVADLERVAAK